MQCGGAIHGTPHSKNRCQITNLVTRQLSLLTLSVRAHQHVNNQAPHVTVSVHLDQRGRYTSGQLPTRFGSSFSFLPACPKAAPLISEIWGKFIHYIVTVNSSVPTSVVAQHVRGRCQTSQWAGGWNCRSRWHRYAARQLTSNNSPSLTRLRRTSKLATLRSRVYAILTFL